MRKLFCACFLLGALFSCGNNIYQSVEVEDKKAASFISRSISSSERLLKKIESEFRYLDKFEN